MPDVIPITDFRRDTARIIAAQGATERPVYVTQGGYVTAVVLSPEHYRGLVRRAERPGATARGRIARCGRQGAEALRRGAGSCSLVDAETAEMLGESVGWDFE